MRKVILLSMVILSAIVAPFQSMDVVAQERVVLEAPTEVSVVQTEYGASGVLRVSWSNPEMYGFVEVAVDGEVVDVLFLDEGDGADGIISVSSVPGNHEFSVRGAVGDESVSSWASATFEVLEVSPILEPVTELNCEYVPVDGGLLRLSWALGSDTWDAGRLQLSDTAFGADIDAGATGVQILIADTTSLLTSENLLIEDVVVLVFVNSDGYFSQPFLPACIRLIPDFRRSDCDGDAIVNITDPIFHLNHLFLDGPRGPCDDACDANDDGQLDVSDAIATLNHLFVGSGAPPDPGPIVCGVDPTDDFLGGICSCPGL